MTNSIVKPQPNKAVKIKWTVLKAPAGVNAANVLNEDPVGSQQYWMKFNNITDTGRYTMQYCVADTGTPCETCDTAVVKINGNTSGVFNLYLDGNKIMLWPNPLLGGNWQIANSPANGKYYLMQLDGRIIASGQLEKQKENIIESHSIPSGVYQLVLDFDNMGKYCLKAIKI